MLLHPHRMLIIFHYDCLSFFFELTAKLEWPWTTPIPWLRRSSSIRGWSESVLHASRVSVHTSKCPSLHQPWECEWCFPWPLSPWYIINWMFATIFIFLSFFLFTNRLFMFVDFEFLVVSRRSFLEMADRAGAFEKSWPGYKENYYEMSEEKRISTLKVLYNQFIWFKM